MTFRPFLYRSAKRLLNRLPAWLLRARPFGIYEIELVEPLAETERNRIRTEQLDCQFKWINGQAEAATLASVANPQTIAEFDPKMRRVAAAYYDGQAIGCAWIACDSFEERELGIQFLLQPCEVWLFAAVVKSDFCNRGIYGRLLQFLCDELRRTEVRRILLGVAMGNENSRRAHARQNARQIGSVFAVRSLGVTLGWCRGAVQRLSHWPLAWKNPARFAVDQSQIVDNAM